MRCLYLCKYKKKNGKRKAESGKLCFLLRKMCGAVYSLQRTILGSVIFNS